MIHWPPTTDRMPCAGDETKDARVNNGGHEWRHLTCANSEGGLIKPHTQVFSKLNAYWCSVAKAIIKWKKLSVWEYKVNRNSFWFLREKHIPGDSVRACLLSLYDVPENRGWTINSHLLDGLKWRTTSWDISEKKDESLFGLVLFDPVVYKTNC